MWHKRLASLFEIQRRYEALHVGLHMSGLPPVNVLLAEYLQNIALLKRESRRLGGYELVLVGVVREQSLHVDLGSERYVVVGRYDLERDAALGDAQLVLELFGRGHTLAVDFLDDEEKVN